MAGLTKSAVVHGDECQHQQPPSLIYLHRGFLPLAGQGRLRNFSIIAGCWNADQARRIAANIAKLPELLGR